MVWMEGHCLPSLSLQIAPNLDDTPSSCAVFQKKPWQLEKWCDGALWAVTRRVQSPVQGMEHPGASRGWVHPARKWLCRKGSGDPVRYQADHEPAICHCCNKGDFGKNSLGALSKIFSVDQEVILYLCSALVRPQLWCWVQFRASHHKRDMKILKRVQKRATEMIKRQKAPHKWGEVERLTSVQPGKEKA